MGSSNREYMQEDYEPKGSAWGYDFPTTKWLLIITVAIYFLQSVMVHDRVFRERPSSTVAEHDFDNARFTPVAHRQIAFAQFAPKESYVEDWFALDADKVFHGQIWRLVSHIFLHYRENPWPLVMNMLVLYFFGARLERMYGSREILWFYLASGLVGGLVFTALATQFFLPVPLMGAGSSAFALFTLYATHFPREEMLICWIIPVQIRVALMIYAAVDIYWICQAYSGASSWAIVAYGSQLWGIGFGYLYRKMDWHLQGIAEYLDFRSMRRAWRRAATARKLKVIEPDPLPNLDEQVDAILAKIHEQGSESLTDRERHILQKASEQAKNRH